MSIELVLADPHPIMLEGLCSVFRDEAGFSVCSSVLDGETAWQAVQRLKPKILIHELNLPHKDGLNLIRAIRGDGLPTISVVFTSATHPQVMQAIDLGVYGLIGKDKPREVLLDCVHTVLRGEPWLDHDLPRERPDKPTAGAVPDALRSLLTTREWSVVQLLVEGLPNKRIAHLLNISEGTAKLHLHHIYQKLQCSGRLALMLYMKDRGLG